MKYCFYFIATLLSFTMLSCSSDTEIPIVETEDDTMEEVVMEDDLPTAPEFSLEALDGQTLSLDQFEDKTLVIFFFGHNCPPCVSVGPTLEAELNQGFNANNEFAMIGIDVWDGNNTQVESFRDKTESTYPLGLNGSSIMNDFGSNRDRLVVINKEGKIAFSGTSVARNDLDEVKEIVTALLQ